MARKLVLSLILSVLMLGVSTTFAAWTWGDPIYNVGGQEVVVDVAYHVANGSDISALVANSPVTLYVPSNVDASIVDPQGMDVHLVRTGTWDGQGDIPITASVTTPGAFEGEGYLVRILMKVGHKRWQNTGDSGTPVSVDGSIR
jgi:hypothetical protein